MKKNLILSGLTLICFGFIECEKSDSSLIGSGAKTEHVKDDPNLSDEKPHVHVHDSRYVSKEVKLSGEVKNQLTLTVDSLRKMNVVNIGDLDIVCQSGATTSSHKDTKGVLLKDILEKAEIRQNNHKDRNFYIVARAADDYKATFSWAEIFNNPTGDHVFVVFEKNGEPLKEDGEMTIISLNDTKTGPRHVKWLNSIEIYRVE